MRIKLIYHIYHILVFSIFFSFSSASGNQKIFSLDSNFASVSINYSFEPDTLYLRETFNEKDIPVNEYLTDKLKPIRENFKRINSISNWSYIDTHKLWKTTGIGEAKFYYQNGLLEKIVTRLYGESFQQLTEYYLLNKQLSFVFEKSYTYNRPIYYDSITMKENDGTEIVDFSKSEIQEDRSYFEKEDLMHKIEGDDCGAPFSKDFLLQEQQRIKSEYTKLIDLINE